MPAASTLLLACRGLMMRMMPRSPDRAASLMCLRRCSRRRPRSRRPSTTRSRNSPRIRSATPKPASPRSPRAAIRCAADDHRGAAECAAVLRPGDQENLHPPGRAAARSTRRPATPVNAPADLKQVRINNRLRRAIEAALGGLTLLSPDPKKRLEAAQAVFKSRDAALLANARDRARQGNRFADQARARRSARRRHSLQARCAARPTSSKPSHVIARARRPGSARGPVRDCPPIRRRASCRARRTASPRSRAISRCGRRCRTPGTGLSLGSVLLLAAIGLAITFGVMGVINMAHGEMVMIGAYVTFAVQEMIRTHNPALFDYSLLIAVPLAFLVAGAARHSDRAQHHPLSLWPPARNAARDLGPFADPAAGGAHHVRPDQPRSRQSVLDERRVRGRQHHHHL